MCFSAPASFVASGGLLGAGAASLAKASRKNRILALMPVLFGVQQLFEGAQWMAISRGETNLFAVYGFLFFALLVWPIYAPLALLLTDPVRAKVARVLLVIGSGISLFLAWSLATHPPGVEAVCSNLRYDYFVPFPPASAFIYVGVVCGSALVSSIREYRFFGAVLFASAVLATLISTAVFTSVWCFFAAVLSGLVYVYLRRSGTKLART